MSNFNQFGLVGRNISYSFSKKYFTEKFSKENLGENTYENFDIADITEFQDIIEENPDLKGLNVTIPFKQSVIPYLDKVSKKANAIGAVNTIKITKKGRLKGYNTDWFGFKKSLLPLLHPHHRKALILGTGGASKAVAYALEKLDIGYLFVSRNEGKNTITYDQVSPYIMEEYTIVVNCTPLGTSPDTDAAPEIPYNYFTSGHIAYDLIYNPTETTFLKNAAKKGAVTKNGYEMLVFQAEKAWEIWNS
ncbi:MAG: shikimate dehydrogenase [Flavobacterium sp. BFFFF1]|uniref:shikimate dehydrogenase family protein n=1 Tax=Flavobacterium sp. BFFFF1 TaxID=2015557 RepID=UPI000BD877E3|nr:shikimate dehydrogenase [Flavobacterium sp. BFFFF1]OYU80184.1 MAG: shikimate dehydrogenase [Flavobacterium sp. BFFFF1]